MYDALYDTAPVDGGSMRAAIDRVVANQQRLAECQAEQHRALARLSALVREGAERDFAQLGAAQSEATQLEKPQRSPSMTPRRWLTAALRAVYESIVLLRAVKTTPGRLRRLAELTAAKLGTETFQERHDRAAAERQVRVGKLPDGMSELIVVLPTLPRLQPTAEPMRYRPHHPRRNRRADRSGQPRPFVPGRSHVETSRRVECETPSTSPPN